MWIDAYLRRWGPATLVLSLPALILPVIAMIASPPPMPALIVVILGYAGALAIFALQLVLTIRAFRYRDLDKLVAESVGEADAAVTD